MVNKVVFVIFTFLYSEPSPRIKEIDLTIMLIFFAAIVFSDFNIPFFRDFLGLKLLKNTFLFHRRLNGRRPSIFNLFIDDEDLFWFAEKIVFDEI